MIKRKLEGQKESISRFISINRDSGPLVALKEISNTIPKTIKINVVEYIFNSKPDGSGVVKLRVEADSFDTIVKFEEELKKVKVFSDIEEKSSDSKPGTDIKVAVIETNYIPSDIVQ